MNRSHFDKVLSHAEQKLISSPRSRPADLLHLYQKFLKMEEHRLRIRHRAGGGGREVCQGRAQLIDVILRHIFRGATEYLQEQHAGSDLPRLVLVAVGGYGRGELNPHSDVDIMFLHDDTGRKLHPFIDEGVQQVLYMLWDIGFKVGHASRSVADAVEHANGDMQSRTAMIEARLLQGDPELFESFRRKLFEKCVRPHASEYIAARIVDQAERHRKFGGTVFLQEPNVKNGCGGLRDLQNLRWMAFFKDGVTRTQELVEKGWITRTEREQLRSAYDFLLRVRNELHYRAGRANDVINLNLQGKIADAFGYEQKTVLRRIEVFMRDYYTHARNIFQITGLAADRMALDEERKPAPRFNFLARMQKRNETIDGFLFTREQITFADRNVFKEDPHRLIRVFLYQQQRQLPLSPELRALIRSKLDLVDRQFRYSAAARETFRAILESKGQVGRTLRLMHEEGFLGRYVPDFGKMTCLVQHEFFHRYTADEHTLKCLEELDKIIDATQPPYAKYAPIFQNLEAPFVLYLALLMHDTGRAVNSRHHSDQSAKNAMHIAKRLHLAPQERSQLVLLVDNHLTMSDFGRKRDLYDPAVVEEFARIVKTPETLDMLHLLTFADSMAVGSSEGGDWRELSHWQLYSATRRQLAAGPEGQKFFEVDKDALKQEVFGHLAGRNPEDQAFQVEAHFELMPPRYFVQRTAEAVAEDLDLVGKFLGRQASLEDSLTPAVRWQHFAEAGHSRVSVCTWDREKLFMKIAGAFTLAELNILNAAIYTRRDDIVLDFFRVCTTRFEAVTDPRDIRQVETALKRALTEPDFDLSGRIARLRGKHPAPEPLPERFPQKIILDNDVSSEWTMVEIVTADRLGLLFDLLEVLSDLNLNIALAKVSTEKGAAFDTFYVTDREGQKLLDPGVQDTLKQSIRAVLA